jgi:hypothetical protein
MWRASEQSPLGRKPSRIPQPALLPVIEPASDS